MAKLSLARKELAEKKMKIQIVAIYIVDVQTGINAINLLSCMLNSTEFGIYPAHNVKCNNYWHLKFICRIIKTSNDV